MPYRAALSQAVLKLQETNRLKILKNRWWKEKRGGGACKVSLRFFFAIHTKLIELMQTRMKVEVLVRQLASSDWLTSVAYLSF